MQQLDEDTSNEGGCNRSAVERFDGRFDSYNLVRRYVSCMFFFSSRRRHTRFDCDWSSDVCSSDLFPRENEVGFAKHARMSAPTNDSMLAEKCDDSALSVTIAVTSNQGHHS